LLVDLNALKEQVRARRALPPPHARRALRVAAGVSLETLAASIGVSRECVRLWELGAAEPSEKNLVRYLEALRVLRGDDVEVAA
jgi:DNA-binding transcriptional regulator YiaG